MLAGRWGRVGVLNGGFQRLRVVQRAHTHLLEHPTGLAAALVVPSSDAARRLTLGVADEPAEPSMLAPRWKSPENSTMSSRLDGGGRGAESVQVLRGHRDMRCR